jgi:uncharacterized protein (DUF362 family)
VIDSGVGLAFASAPDGSAYANHAELRRVIREAMGAFGLGQTNPAVPLSDIIEPGQSVLIKPNWVLHRNQSGATMDCMITHPAFILATLAEVIAANAGKVMIADAPIQSADFALLTPASWRGAAQEIAGTTPLSILDFRNTVSTYDGVRIVAREGLRDRSRFVEFDLGMDSLLEPVTEHAGQFRCTNYNPDDLAKVQRPGVHRFLLCKEPFEADVVLNLPKLKTHAKGGITAALKNLVGMNGDKNYLPHHRVGGSGFGGDCYEGVKPFKRLGERILDAANRRIGRTGYVTAVRTAYLANRIHGGDLEGKWWGNDTTWRMVLDLNRILLYGDSSGVMHETVQRRIFSLTDGIVAGQRNGPLAPEPIALGAVTFAANSAHADAAHLALMRFDAQRVSLVREAFARFRYPIVCAGLEETRVSCDGAMFALDDVASRFGRDFQPPDGWVDRVEHASRRLAASALSNP